jgi:hypothetical protein
MRLAPEECKSAWYPTRQDLQDAITSIKEEYDPQKKLNGLFLLEFLVSVFEEDVDIVNSYTSPSSSSSSTSSSPMDSSAVSDYDPLGGSLLHRIVTGTSKADAHNLLVELMELVDANADQSESGEPDQMQMDIIYHVGKLICQLARIYPVGGAASSGVDWRGNLLKDVAGLFDTSLSKFVQKRAFLKVRTKERELRSSPSSPSPSSSFSPTFA